MTEESHFNEDVNFDVAIIGMAGRFPGAQNINEFWNNLTSGKESISFFDQDDLRNSGINPSILNNPKYVNAAPELKDFDQFDAAFFGYSPREAKFMDPQQRLFLECSWQALENAGYDPDSFEGPIGVFGGTAMNTYFMNSGLASNFVAEYLPTLIGNDNSFLATRVSYKLNLTGPSVTVQTACSTSLVAVHQASQSLLNEECDIALAGGVSVRVPNQLGHLHQDGGVLSPDGHCRPFDEKAQGTIFGSGVGIVVLKRLSEAIDDGDHIFAVIKGSAINNDGSRKTNYTAPSVNSQSEVVVEAMSNAGVSADTISYIECHGTGTYLGDPIELTALKKAFRLDTDKNSFCAVGSVKSNVGHLDAASGVTGLIKTALALQHKQIPATINFDKPNPEIDFQDSPFFVNDKLTDWKSTNGPRRAGITSLGIGGTNAHVILEEAPPRNDTQEGRPYKLLLLSAKSPESLDHNTISLSKHLQDGTDQKIEDVAYTLQVGRHLMPYRRFVVCEDRISATQWLDSLDSKHVFTSNEDLKKRDVVFMLPGGGAQFPNMAADLYRSELVFRQVVDNCLTIMSKNLDGDLKEIMYPPKELEVKAADQLKKPAHALPALFITEYALAKLWMSWGITPSAMIGHSMGEYTAACLAGVIDLKDALYMVTLRGKLFETLDEGGMLSVSLGESDAKAYMSDELSFAAINGPNLCLASGPISEISKMERALSQDDVEYRRLQISVAAHSEMVEPILDEFAKKIAHIKFEKPDIPFLSNVTGEWVNEEVKKPEYWVKHLRQPVRFEDGLKLLLTKADRVLLEVGPGRTLSTLANQHPDKMDEQIALSSLRHPKEEVSDSMFQTNTLGKLILAGVKIDWDGYYQDEARHRVPLPDYSFDHKRFWLQADQNNQLSGFSGENLKNPNISDWTYLSTWKPAAISIKANTEVRKLYLAFINTNEFHHEFIASLEKKGHRIISVQSGKAFVKVNEHQYVINPRQQDDYHNLLVQLKPQLISPFDIIHLWNNGVELRSGNENFNRLQFLGFYSLIYLGNALRKQNYAWKTKITAITNGTQFVTGQEGLIPECSTILAPLLVIPQENTKIFCSGIDLEIDSLSEVKKLSLIGKLVTEIESNYSDVFVAYRANQRVVQDFEPYAVELSPPTSLFNGGPEKIGLRNQGVYLITGGLGQLGLLIANYLAERASAKIILLSRSQFPNPKDWNHWIESKGENEPISQKILKLREIKSKGAEIILEQADVSNEPRMHEIVDRAIKKFGRINGVIHAAGFISEGAFKFLEQIDEKHCHMHFSSKVYGTMVLNKIFQEKEVDFILATSSMSSILGGLGYVGYCAANIFMDTFAQHSYRSSDTPWIAIDWDIWDLSTTEEHLDKLRGATLVDLAITPEEGVILLDAIFSSDYLPRLFISTGNLNARISQWVNLGNFQETEDSSFDISPSDIPANANSKVEHGVIKIWMNLLGADEISITDDFFKLGGSSLIATQVMSRIRDMFEVELTISDMFDFKTVEQLSKRIKELQKLKLAEFEKLQDLLEEFKGLKESNKNITKKPRQSDE